MNDRRGLDLDRVLGAFLGAGPTQAPDRILFGALDEVAATPQRRPLLGHLRFPMSTPLRFGLVAAVLVGLLVAGAIYVGNHQAPTPSIGPSASPTISASPAPSATAVATAIATPAVSAATLARSALQRVDKAVTSNLGNGGFTLEDQNRLLQRIDDLSTLLTDGPFDQAGSAYAALSADVDARIGKLDAASQAQLSGAMASLGRMLRAVPFTSGDLAAGVYFATRFNPVVAVELPGGWRRVIEDAEVVALQKGGLTLAFDRIAASATEAGLVASIGASVTNPVDAVTLGRFAGFTTEVAGGGTLWFTEALQAHDSAVGSLVRVWVVDVGGRALTIHLDGPPAELEAASAEVEAILETLESQ